MHVALQIVVVDGWKALIRYISHFKLVVTSVGMILITHFYCLFVMLFGTLFFDYIMCFSNY